MTDSSEPRNDEFDADDDGFALPTGSQVAGSPTQDFEPHTPELDLTEPDEFGPNPAGPDEGGLESLPDDAFVDMEVLDRLVTSREPDEPHPTEPGPNEPGPNEPGSDESGSDESGDVDAEDAAPVVIAPLIAAIGESVVSGRSPSDDLEDTDADAGSGADSDTDQDFDDAADGGSKKGRDSKGREKKDGDKTSPEKKEGSLVGRLLFASLGPLVVAVGVMVETLGLIMITAMAFGVQAYDVPDDKLAPAISAHDLVFHMPTSDLDSVDPGVVVVLNGQNIDMGISTKVDGDQVWLHDNIVRTPVQAGVAKMSNPVLVAPAVGPIGTVLFTVLGAIGTAMVGLVLCVTGVLLPRSRRPQAEPKRRQGR